MRAKRNPAKQITGTKKNDDKKDLINHHFEILVKQLSSCSFTVEEAAAYKKRFDEALKKAAINKIRGYENEFFKTNTLLLNEGHQSNGSTLTEEEINENRRDLRLQQFKKIITLLIAVALITLGLSMIIIPAPPYFEMFTIFYFNDNDGVTIMDVISLIIVLCGVYLFVTTLIKKANSKSLL